MTFLHAVGGKKVCDIPKYRMESVHLLFNVHGTGYYLKKGQTIPCRLSGLSLKKKNWDYDATYRLGSS
jgi:hypothetical protein